MIKGLLLDFYGTVVEDDDATMLAIAERVAAGSPARPAATDVLADWEREYAAVAAGTPFRNLRDCAVRSLATVMAAHGCPGDPAEYGAGQFSGQVLPLRPGTRDFLSRVTVPICVVSDADHAVLSAAIAHHGLRFDAVVCSERVGAYKPHAAMFGHGLAALGLDAADVMHVGDSLRADVAGANAAGIRSVWVNRHGRPAADGAAATHVVADLSELAAHL
ncbi:HAD family hydrolase [Paractinoplanes rhizophilus]|uniref:HAD family hydrolase n=1 Tax=Paractinoplanes rhizophilus TaxID=1416877 RepID=A0ABW2HXQ9_9ACTN